MLDAVLAERGLRWLGSEREKVAYFTPITALRATELPHLAFTDGRETTIRHFPDKLPIGILSAREN